MAQAPTPPKNEWFSINSVLAPVRAAPSAAPMPAGPPPTTSTSTVSSTFSLLFTATDGSWPAACAEPVLSATVPATAIPAVVRNFRRLRDSLFEVFCILFISFLSNGQGFGLLIGNWILGEGVWHSCTSKQFHFDPVVQNEFLVARKPAQMRSQFHIRGSTVCRPQIRSNSCRSRYKSAGFHLRTGHC